MDESISIEELQEILSQYFYTKEEQSENSLAQNELDLSNQELLIKEIQKIGEINQTALNLSYLNTVGIAGVLILTLYYRFLAQFRERWF